MDMYEEPSPRDHRIHMHVGPHEHLHAHKSSRAIPSMNYDRVRVLVAVLPNLKTFKYVQNKSLNPQQFASITSSLLSVPCMYMLYLTVVVFKQSLSAFSEDE